MGFLNRLFSKRPSFEDRACLTRELKFADLTRRLASDRSDEAVDCLVVYHFPDTGEHLQSRLQQAGSDWQILQRPGTDWFENLQARVGSRAALLASDEIPEEIKRAREPMRRSGANSGRRCHVHLAEHFPLPYRDDHVLNLQAILPPGSKFFCYDGLDEPWIRNVLGSSTRELMVQLGMSDEEPLVHSMIGSALRRSQEQLVKKQRGVEHHARSGDEWMRLNVDE